MNWSCAQTEERLTDYLEGRLAVQEATAADAHARGCPRCAEWADARRAALWLQGLEPLEAPPGLETRILAQTLTPPLEENLWMVLDRGWRLLLQPRFAFGLVAAVISLSLVLNAFNLSPRNFSLADLNPANIYRTLDRQAHLTYAHGVRFVNDLRLVYEIRSRLEELRPETAAPPAASPAPGGSSPSSPDNERKRDNPNDGARVQWLLALGNLRALGGLR